MNTANIEQLKKLNRILCQCYKCKTMIIRSNFPIGPAETGKNSHSQQHTNLPQGYGYVCLTPVSAVCNYKVYVRMDLTGAGMREQVPENEWVHKIRVMSINISKPKRNT